MTRITDFGRKRTHVEAGFATHDDIPLANKDTDTVQSSRAPESKAESSRQAAADNLEAFSAAPPKKKRKRTPKSKRDGHAAEKAAEAARLNGEDPPISKVQPEAEKYNTESSEPTLSRLEKKQKRNLARRLKVTAITEARRLKRIRQKNSELTCFACREKGHLAKDCKSSEADAEGEEYSGPAVGVCYRCGSKKHSLSRCKKREDPANPFPYASCFVCNGKGHLASACPLNKAKGVYPNGGSCKLCGETTHLARDCGIRQKVTDPTAAVLGTGHEAGADEDDFHLLKRKTIEMEQDEKQQIRLKEMLDVRTGAHSGAVKAYGHVPPPPLKKIVVFK